MFVLWVGWAVTIAFAIVFLYILFEVLLGIVVACSILRFTYYCKIEAGVPPNWEKLPRAFLRTWWEHVGDRRGSVTIRSKYGTWYWIGDWHVYETLKETK